MSFPIFTGNRPANVAKDAKYLVRSSRSGPVIGLIYSSDEDERWHASTDEHPKLAKMVNDVKSAISFTPNGSFYINEFKQVIVPVVGSDNYYYAGKYREKLRFEFEEYTLSGEPFDLQGNPLSVGDEWGGPHPGIPYVLAAGGRDIKYTYVPRPNVERTVRLSKQIGKMEAAAVAGKIMQVKGALGGRFYVNEYGVIFAPIQEGYDWCYRYLGKLNLKEWFPEPMTEPEAPPTFDE